MGYGRYEGPCLGGPWNGKFYVHSENASWVFRESTPPFAPVHVGTYVWEPLLQSWQWERAQWEREMPAQMREANV